jgi:hypothetical protein
MLAAPKPSHHALAVESCEACVQADAMKRSCSSGYLVETARDTGETWGMADIPMMFIQSLRKGSEERNIGERRVESLPSLL